MTLLGNHILRATEAPSVCYTEWAGAIEHRTLMQASSPSPGVLVVDDDPGVAFVVTHVLARYQEFGAVESASTAQAGLARLEACATSSPGSPSPPAIVMLDLAMPRMNGFAFLDQFAALRVHDELAPIAVVILSTSHREQDRARAMRFEFVHDYIPKPFGEQHVPVLRRLLPPPIASCHATGRVPN